MRGRGAPRTAGHQAHTHSAWRGPPDSHPSAGTGAGSSGGDGVLEPLPQPMVCPHGGMSSQSLPASCPLPSPPAAQLLRPVWPPAHRQAPLLPLRGALGPFRACLCGDAGARQRPVRAAALAGKRPLFQAWCRLPSPLPKEEGMWTLCWLAPAVDSKTPKRVVRAGQGGQLGPPGLLPARKLTGFGPGSFKVPGSPPPSTHVQGRCGG